MFGLGKPRSKYGKYIDKHDIKQEEIKKGTNLSKDTVSRLCNDDKYKPHPNTQAKATGFLRRRGHEKRREDFW